MTKDAEGFVHLEGAMQGLAQTSEYAGTIPVGFRPPSGIWVNTSATDGASDPELVQMEITPEGSMYIANSAGANDGFVGLTGITYYVGN